MNKTSIIVVEKSYLLRRGIVSVLQEATNADQVLEYESPEQANVGHLKLGAVFVVINTDLYREWSKTEHLLTKKQLNTRFVGICTGACVQEPDAVFEEVLYTSDTHGQLQEKLNKIFNTQKPKENELTQRENDIVRCIALGKTNKEIADSLFISPHTVITHRKNITQKLGIKSVSGLTVFAILNNLITVDEVNE